MKLGNLGIRRHELGGKEERGITVHHPSPNPSSLAITAMISPFWNEISSSPVPGKSTH
jgi:hypothetical protein